jgi:enamine deaminase RidA (YjgF/YER057c/UK114 family)
MMPCHQREVTYAEIEPYAAPGVYDPPMYSQAVKVTGTETILFIAGQVASRNSDACRRVRHCNA